MTHAFTGAMEAPITLEDFADLPEEDRYKLELVRGYVVREPRPMPLHGRVAARLTRFLDEHVDAGRLGAVLVEVDFLLHEEPPTVRAPDIAFVWTGRLPPDPYAPAYWRFAPDLAVEILSPTNHAAEMQRKVLEYLDAGSRMVWVIDPDTRTAASYSSRTNIQLLGPDEALHGGDVVPGFYLPLARLFEL
jgi:Uma2 family endonuclease